MKYTQREWDRIVGWGKVPEEYRHTVSTGKTDGENTERSDTHREEDERTLEEGKEYALNDPIWDKRWMIERTTLSCVSYYTSAYTIWDIMGKYGICVKIIKRLKEYDLLVIKFCSLSAFFSESPSEIISPYHT